jgi:ankyrin repeat protein
LLNALILRNAPIDNGLLALAAKFDSPAVIQRLIAYGIGVNTQFSPDNSTALHFAVARKRYRSIAALLQAGAKTDIPDSREMTALDVAVKLKDDRIVQALRQEAMR